MDIADDKWNVGSKKNSEVTSFAYAGSPSALKEKLNVIVRAIIECGKTERIVFNVVGITKDQFVQMYSWAGDLPKEIVFWGRIPHTDVIRIVRESSWSIILRDNNIVVKAGFPTKLVESISCGTPVIVNRFSNVTDYLTKNNSLLINSKEEIAEAIKTACKYTPIVDREQFDYRRYTSIIHEAVS